MGYIKQPQTVWWRKALFQVHLWIGAFIGLYLIAICLSGSLLVFEPNLLNDTPHLPNATMHRPATWDQMVQTALKANPEATLSYIDMRSLDRRVVPVGLNLHGQTLIVFIDSFNNRIVGHEVLQQKHWFVEFMESLHNQLALGAEGAVANGIGGSLLFVMAMTGIVLWWPGTRNWKRALVIKWRARWARINWDVHSAFGFWCFLLIAMWGITGCYFIFPRPFDRAIQVVSPMPSMRQLPSGWKPGDPVLPVGEYIHRAQQLYPNDKLAYVFMDVNRPHGEVQVYLSRNPSVPMPLLEDEIVFQPATGAVLSNTSSAHWTAGERLSVSIYSVHFGNFAGLPGQILWALLGLVPVILVVTGYIMWWNRALKKQWAKLTAMGRRNLTEKSPV
jgi:uncharacterized iron-regulated membrane protein